MLRTRKLEQIARQIYAEYREDFLPDYLPVDVDEAEYIAAFRTVYHQQATHDLIWENIELFAARYLTTNLRIDVRPFVLSGIDVGADVRDMIVGGDESKTSLSLFGDIATDLPVSFSAEPSFEARWRAATARCSAFLPLPSSRRRRRPSKSRRRPSLRMH